MIRKFVVQPGEFGPEIIEVNDDAYVVYVDEDDCPPEPQLHWVNQHDVRNEWHDFMENAPDNVRVSISDLKELWS